MPGSPASRPLTTTGEPKPPAPRAAVAIVKPRVSGRSNQRVFMNDVHSEETAGLSPRSVTATEGNEPIDIRPLVRSPVYVPADGIGRPPFQAGRRGARRLRGGPGGGGGGATASPPERGKP